jgi:hypothetical protein
MKNFHEIFDESFHELFQGFYHWSFSPNSSTNPSADFFFLHKELLRIILRSFQR